MNHDNGNNAPQSGSVNGMDQTHENDQEDRLDSRQSSSSYKSGRSGERRSREEKSRSGERRSQKTLGWYSRGYLPHCDTPGLIQHVTYHLAGSLPDSVLERFRNEVELLPVGEEKKKVRLREKIEVYLDAGHGSSILREPEIAACVAGTWFHFDGERYRLLEWVIMPNHCHVLIEVLEKAPLWRIISSWKNYTARFINQYQDARERRSPERPGQDKYPPIWHRDYWDRYIRDDSHYERVKAYIALNPVKAGLVKRPEDWMWSSSAMRKHEDEGK